MKKLIVIYGLLLILFPFFVKPITANAFDYDYNNFIKIDNDDKFNQEKQNIKKLYILDPKSMEEIQEQASTTGDLISLLSEDFGINIKNNDFIAVVDFQYNLSKNNEFLPPFFSKNYIKWESNPQDIWSNKKITMSAYFFGTNKYNKFEFPLFESTGKFNFARYITNKDTLEDNFTYTSLNKSGQGTHKNTLTYKIHIDSLYKYQSKQGFFEFRKLDNINRYTPQTPNRPKSIFNYAYSDTELDDNLNLKTTGKRTLFASYAETEFHNYIAKQEQRYLDYFKTIKPTRQVSEYKAFSDVNINGKTIRIPWFTSPLDKTTGTLYYDIDGNLSLFFNDAVLNEVRAQRQKHFQNLPMVRNTDIKPTDKFLDPNDLYPDYAKNYEEAKTKPFPTSIEEFEKTIDTSKIEVKKPDTSSWSSWNYWKKYIQIGKVYEIREKKPDKETLIKIYFVSKEKLERESRFNGRTHQDKLENLQFGKILGNYKSLEFGHTAFGDIGGVYGIDYYLEMYYSATDNSYDYKKYENISDEYSYIDDIYDYQITKHGYYVFRLFNSLTNEVKEYHLHYAPKVDADTTEHRETNSEYHYTEHSVKNMLPHINDLDAYDVYYSPSAEITQNNFHSHTKLTTDDFGNAITPNTTSSKLFKKGYYLVKYKAKTEDTYKFTKFEIKAQDLKYEYYNGTDKLDSSQLSPDPIYTNKPFKLNVLSPKEHWQLEVWKLNSQTNEWNKIPGKWNDKYISDEGIFKLKLINLQAYEEFEQIFNKSNASPAFDLANAQKDVEPNTYISGTNPVLTLKNTEYQLNVENKTTGQTLEQNEYRETFEFTTAPETTTEYLVKITDKHGNFVEFTIKVDKRTPKIKFKDSNKPANPRLTHNAYPLFDKNLFLEADKTDKITYTKDKGDVKTYNKETLTHGIYSATVENKLGLKTSYKFIVYTSFSEINTQINSNNTPINADNQQFFINSELPNVFNFSTNHYLQNLTVFELKDGKETEIYKKDIQKLAQLTAVELANFKQNGKFKYVFTDILGKTREFIVEKNTEISDLEINGVNSQNLTNGNILLTHKSGEVKLYVNGELKSLPYEITENGVYELKIVDKYGNEKTYTVERKKQELNLVIKDLETNEQITTSETNKKSYVELEQDWQLYEKQENDWKLIENRPDKLLLDKHKLYEYKIVDKYGNEKVFKLTVSLQIGEIKHNFTKPNANLTNKPAVFDWQDISITAVFKETNEPYTKGSTIEKPGKYTLVFTDKFGHTKEITFEYRPKLDKIELITNNQHTVLKYSTVAVNHNFKFDTTNDLFLFNKGKWQPITPNYEFSKEATYKFKATDKFGNETTFTVQYKRLATIKKEENKLTVIVVSIFGAILAVLIVIILVLKIKNNAKNSPFKQKKTPTQQPK